MVYVKYYSSSFKRIYSKYFTKELETIALKVDNCHFCGCFLDWRLHKGKRPESNYPTLDRINNDKILSLENVEIICYRCNLAKGSLAKSEFLEYIKTVYLLNCEKGN